MLNNDTVYWMGHQMLGDVIGFVAAAHLYSVKIQTPVKIHFQPLRREIIEYFDGVQFIDSHIFEKTKYRIDCGIDPTISLWPTMNGVKRFYRFMDHTLTSPKSFDIHFNRHKQSGNHSLIGLITHSNTQGDIPRHKVDLILKEAEKLYPNHKIIAIGNMDNKYIPDGIEDHRTNSHSIHPIINIIQQLDLLIAPQTGPCFIAAGFNIPMWIYKSKYAYHDYVLNYDTYKVTRWFER